jgi:uncharacterized protein (DUF58 family)
MSEDSARHVDWKATAKSGSLKVREFSREDERKLRIVFDNPAEGVISEKAYEDAVALAASLSWHFADENTDMSFAAQGYGGEPDIHRFLMYLAVVQPQSAPSVLETLRPSDDYNIILTTRPRGSIPTALWACSYLVFLGLNARMKSLPKYILFPYATACFRHILAPASVEIGGEHAYLRFDQQPGYLPG